MSETEKDDIVDVLSDGYRYIHPNTTVNLGMSDYREARDEILRLRTLIDGLIKALGYFLDDARFTVMVGGNPIAVEEMMSEARETYLNAQSQNKKEG